MARKKRILCISYDEPLLTTRKMILEQAGFFVTPAYGFAEASRICRFDHMFDLIVMGHSIPRADKTALIEMLKPDCNAPVLSIRRHTEPPLKEADFSVDSHDGPDALLLAVKSALREENLDGRAYDSNHGSQANTQKEHREGVARSAQGTRRGASLNPPATQERN
jgi:DNA-binding NtrC family response regulator